MDRVRISKKREGKGPETMRVVVNGIVYPSDRDVFDVLKGFREGLLKACPPFELEGGTQQSDKDMETGRLTFQLAFRALVPKAGK